MPKSHRRGRSPLSLAALALVATLGAVSATPAGAQTVRADASGSDNVATPGFWGVQFQSGSGFIQSVSFDLTPDAGAFFDFDGDSSFGDATAPQLSSLIGLAAGNITPSYGSFVSGDASHPAILTFGFTAGSFGVGDSFRFGADTDFFFSDPAAGGAIGSGGALFRVTFEGGATASGVFSRVSATESEVIVRGANQAVVPEPATYVTLGSGLLILGAIARRRRSAAR